MNMKTTIAIGDQVQIEKKITEADIIIFAGLSGDFNPIHLDEEFAKKTRYQKRIAHGFLGASLFSGLFGTKLPGPGCVYAKQSLSFLRPVYIDDKVTARITVAKIENNGKRIIFKTDILVENRVVTTGEATLVFP